MHQRFRKGSLTGKAVVPKTTALVACRFDSCPSLQFTEASPNWYGSGLLNRRALRVRMQVRLLSPPPDFLRSGRAGKARVSETRLRRFESYLRDQLMPV